MYIFSLKNTAQFKKRVCLAICTTICSPLLVIPIYVPMSKTSLSQIKFLYSLSACCHLEI